ncbi:hypothetical protein [Staphylospora marina]|uniref:hypothetical protein n=1 Tax=Staphylospora marina TaxID=2490858 RepID=UPI000F5C06D7|nr:hypothetical protein [Staphylospora marina]
MTGIREILDLWAVSDSPWFWVFEGILIILYGIVLWQNGSFLAVLCISAGLQVAFKETFPSFRALIRGLPKIPRLAAVLVWPGLAATLPVAGLLTSTILLADGKLAFGFSLLIMSGVSLAVLSMAWLHVPLIAAREQTGTFRALSMSFLLFRRHFSQVFVSSLWTLPFLLAYIGSTALWSCFLLFIVADPRGDALFGTLLFVVVPLGFSLSLGAVLLAPAMLVLCYRYVRVLRPLLVQSCPDAYEREAGDR